MPNKSLRNRLLNYRYYYTHGLFDLVRRPEKHLLTQIFPERLHTISREDARRQDSLILVSAAYPVSDELSAESLLPLDEKNAISADAEPFLRALIVTCEEACGEKILFTSTFRTLEFQASIYGVNPFAAKPGESEHHSGLVADIKVDGYAQRRFILSKTGKWMAKNAHRFGFIIRYPLWAEKKTGVDYEPWHLRFVGKPHAQIIYRSKITLEEYLERLEIGSFYRYDDYVISRQRGENFTLPPECEACTYSRDTRGGFIVWSQYEEEKRNSRG